MLLLQLATRKRNAFLLTGAPGSPGAVPGHVLVTAGPPKERPWGVSSSLASRVEKELHYAIIRAVCCDRLSSLASVGSLAVFLTSATAVGFLEAG